MCSDAKLDVLWIALWFWFGFVVVCFIETVLYSQAWPHIGLNSGSSYSCPAPPTPNPTPHPLLPAMLGLQCVCWLSFPAPEADLRRDPEGWGEGGHMPMVSSGDGLTRHTGTQVSLLIGHIAY